MKHQYAEGMLKATLNSISLYTDDEFRRAMIRIVNGATGSEIPDDCHLIADQLNEAIVTVRELTAAISTLNFGENHAVFDDNNNKHYLQHEEWCELILALAENTKKRFGLESKSQPNKVLVFSTPEGADRFYEKFLKPETQGTGVFVDHQVMNLVREKNQLNDEVGEIVNEQ